MLIEIEIIGDNKTKKTIVSCILILLKISSTIGYNYRITKEDGYGNSISFTKPLEKDPE